MGKREIISINKMFRDHAREIVMIIAGKEDEIRKMGFSSYFLEAIENSIVKLLAFQKSQIVEELEKMKVWGGSEESYADGWNKGYNKALDEAIDAIQKISGGER